MEESKRIISPSCNVTVINNPIKSNTVRLYLGRRCPNDCRDAGRLPRLTELTRCCVAEHCFSGFVTSSARGVAGQIDRNAVPSTAPEEKGGGRRLRDFSPMVEISPVLPALVSCALLQAFCWGSDKQPKRLTRAEAVGWVLWPRGVAPPGCSGRWGCGLRLAGSVLLAALWLVRQLAVGLWRAADTLCCPRGLARLAGLQMPPARPSVGLLWPLQTCMGALPGHWLLSEAGGKTPAQGLAKEPGAAGEPWAEFPQLPRVAVLLAAGSCWLVIWGCGQTRGFSLSASSAGAAAAYHERAQQGSVFAAGL